MQTEKPEYVFALAALLWCLIVSSAQAGTLPESSESKAIDGVGDQNVAPLSIPSPTKQFSIPSPTKQFDVQNLKEKNFPSVMSPSELPDVPKLTNPDENVPLVIKHPAGGVWLPNGEVIGVQKPVKSTANEPATSSLVIFF